MCTEAPARFYQVYNMPCFLLPRDGVFLLASYTLALFRGFADLR
jgi:hypothetical protein